MWWRVEDNKIMLRGTQFTDRDDMLRIGNGIWNPKTYEWEFPATPAQIGRIGAVYPAAVSSTQNGTSDPAFRALIGQWQRIGAAQAEKRAGKPLASPPITARVPPWEHQIKGYWWLMEMPTGGILAFDMGTGKTRVAFDLMQNDVGTLPILVLSPKTVVGVWEEQAPQYLVDSLYPVRVYAPTKGTVEQRIKNADTFLRKSAGHYRPVIVLNYEAAIQPVAQKWLLARRWAMGFADESHRFKSDTSITARFMDKLYDLVDFRVAMTGTPMPHDRMDIWTQVRWVDRAVYQTRFVAFRENFAVRIEGQRRDGQKFRKIVSWKNVDEFTARLEPYIFRVRSQDVLDIPEPVHSARYVEMSKAAWRAYLDLAQDYIAEIVDPVTQEVKAGIANNILTKFIRLRQITSGFLGTGEYDEKEEIVFDHAKEKALGDYLEDLPIDEPLVVFAQFRQDLDAIRRAVEAAGREVFEVSGRTNSTANITNWRASATNGKGAVIAVQIQAGGLGIDLTAAHYAVIYSLDFNLGNYEQVMKRIHRGNQSHVVSYTHLIVSGTIDVDTYTALRNKKTDITWLLNQFVQNVMKSDPDDGLSVAMKGELYA